MTTLASAPDAHAIAVMPLAAAAIGLFTLQRVPLETSGLVVLATLA